MGIIKKNKTFYFNVPGIELDGHQQDPQERFALLFPFFKKYSNLSILDLGCAEGMLFNIFSNKIKIYHGFDKNEERVKLAQNHLGLDKKNIFVKYFDFSMWEDFIEQNKDILLCKYDLVIFFSVLHKMSSKVKILNKSLSMSKRFYAIRTKCSLFKRYNIKGRIEKMGFSQIYKKRQLFNNKESYSAIFEKNE